MFLLSKLFQLRDHGNPDAEKPFLAHLDDLRVTLTKLILTLLTTTVICYVFRNSLMDIIRHPVEQVWTLSQKESLKNLAPRPSIETWEKAVQVSNDSIGLTAQQLPTFLEHAGTDDPEFAFHVECARHFRIALVIDDEKKRASYINELPGISDEVRSQLKLLVKGNPNAELDARGRMVLMQSLNPTEGFMLSVKLAFFAALVISFPLLLYFLLEFVLPGLHAAEQKALFPALGIGFLLFLTGVLFAYFVILPNVLDFFYQYSLDMGIQNDWRIGYYISFATQFVLIFGLAFELPVVVMTLVKLGILSYDMMRTTRSYAVLAIVVIAAIITPTPDALTLALLAVPMYILYEICIWLSYFMDKKEKAKERAEEEERMERLLATTPAASTVARPEHAEEEVKEDDPVDSNEKAESENDLHEGDYPGAEEEPFDDYQGPDPEAEDLYSQAPIEPIESMDEDPNFDPLPDDEKEKED